MTTMKFSDWTHAISKTPMLKAQHPDYELFVGGIHGRRGVSCADCHMPSKKGRRRRLYRPPYRQPTRKYRQTCLNCHSETEEEFKDLLKIKLERKEQLMELAMNGLARAHLEAGKAWEAGATEEEMKDILQDIRHGQWRWDYSIASHGSFFHNPEETLRLLAQANDKAQQARVKLAAVLAKHGVIGYEVPGFLHQGESSGLGRRQSGERGLRKTGVQGRPAAGMEQGSGGQGPSQYGVAQRNERPLLVLQVTGILSLSSHPASLARLAG